MRHRSLENVYTGDLAHELVCFAGCLNCNGSYCEM